MAKYSVEINGTFEATVEVEIDDDTPKDDVAQTVYSLAEKQLHEMLDKDDYSAVREIELESVNHDEA